MLEDGYINFEEYKKAILNSIGYTFNRSPENIKAPHFVFFVKEYLAKKFGEDIISV
jgi:membrane peptidoglycan carboxypeptidase